MKNLPIVWNQLASITKRKRLSRHMTRIIICEKLIEMEVECMIDNALHLAKTSNPEL
nr:hypothetical protein Iba_chr08bCG12690 [Ipomoea batatas]